MNSRFLTGVASTAQLRSTSTVRDITAPLVCLSDRRIVLLGPMSPNLLLPFSSGRGNLLVPPLLYQCCIAKLAMHFLEVAFASPQSARTSWRVTPEGREGVAANPVVKCSPLRPSRHGLGSAPQRKEEGVTNLGRTTGDSFCTIGTQCSTASLPAALFRHRVGSSRERMRVPGSHSWQGLRGEAGQI